MSNDFTLPILNAGLGVKSKYFSLGLNENSSDKDKESNPKLLTYGKRKGIYIVGENGHNNTFQNYSYH